MGMVNIENFEKIKEALDYGLFSKNAEEWQEQIIDAIEEMASTSEPQISSNCVYWMLMLYEMFGKLKQAGL